MFQTKEWDKTLGKQLSEEETEKEFIEMTVKMIQDLKKHGGTEQKDTWNV